MISNSSGLTTGRLGVLLLLAALFPVFGFAYLALVGLIPQHVLNSDLVQPFMIAHDVVRDPASILSWTLSPAIYVFPDYPIAFLLNALRIGPAYAMIVNGAILGVLLSLAGGYLLFAAGVTTLARGIVVTTLAFFVAILIGLIVPGPLDTIMQTWTITTFIHSGALIGGIGLIGLWTALEFSNRTRPGLFAGALVLAALCAYSDLTFLVYFVVPLGIAKGIVWLPRPDLGRFVRTTTMIVVSAASYLTDRLLRGHLGKGGDFDIAQNIADWWTLVGPRLPENPLLVLFYCMAPVMLARAVFLAVRGLRRGTFSASEFVEIAFAGVQITAILTPILFGMYFELWNLRYSLPISIMPVLWLLILARPWLSRPLHLRRPRLTAVGVWAAALCVAFPAGLAAIPVVTAPPPSVTCMTELGRSAAYGHYWLVKGPVFLSDYRVHMAPILSTGGYYDWNTNREWLYADAGNGTPVTFDTIIMEDLLPPYIRTVYGTPPRYETCRGLVFWLYDTPLPLPPD